MFYITTYSSTRTYSNTIGNTCNKMKTHLFLIFNAAWRGTTNKPSTTMAGRRTGNGTATTHALLLC